MRKDSLLRRHSLIYDLQNFVGI